MRARVVIVCPTTAESNSGNWRTAARWRQLLRPAADVRIVQHWPDAQAEHDTVMLALHARKSAAAIDAWHARHGAHGLGVVLTGTDLYPDITREPLALRSLAQAHSLVVLQPQAVQALPATHRDQARVIVQSCSARQHLHKGTRLLRVVVVGHLREEKNPRMLWRALRQIAPDAGIRVEHIGHALDAALGREAEATAAACPHYRWVPGLDHGETRRRIQRAHLLVHTSRSEGGALVIAEAIRSGTPVLATCIDGNVGLLGVDYSGLLEPDDDQALAARLLQCRASQRQVDGLLVQWQHECAQRAALFDPATEQAALQQWVQALTDLTRPGRPSP